MIGEQVLYRDVVPSSIPQENSPATRNKYMDDRHNMMACRYYYLSIVLRWRYDDCLYQLSNEFSLSTKSATKYLRVRLSYINNMVERGTTTAELRRQYPWYDWSGKLVIPTAPQENPQ